MRRSILFCTLLGIALGQRDPWFVCPKPETVSPCTCETPCEGCNVFFTCANFTSQSQFDEVIKKSDYPFKSARIKDSVLQYIPHEFFEDKQFHYLYVEKCTFRDLIDSELLVQTPLYAFFLNDVEFTHSINFRWFSTMRRLTQLSIVKVEVKKIPSNFCDFMPGKLETLEFNDTKTMKIVDGAFAWCQALDTLSVTHGSIKTIKSNMFPKQLTYLVLSYNKIKSIPDDFATALPKIATIYLDGNQLTSLDEHIFGNYPSLLYVNVENNPFKCDCKLLWKMSHKRPYIEGACTNLDGKRIPELVPNDFVC